MSGSRSVCRAASIGAALTLTTATITAQGQFDPPPPDYVPFEQSVQESGVLQSPQPPMPQLPPLEVGSFDTVRGELINYETQLIKPIHYTWNDRVAVANEPNGTLDILFADLTLDRRIILGQGIASISERTITNKGTIIGSELWVSVRHQQAVAVIRTSDWKITDWLRSPISETGVGYGAADHPGQVAFNQSQSKAYVPSFHTNKLAVFDAENKVHLSDIELEYLHRDFDTPMNTPISLAANPVADELYVIAHVSGNQTMPISTGVVFGGTEHAGTSQTPPDAFAVRTLGPGGDRPDWLLPDFDVLKIDMVDDVVDGPIKNIGAISFGALWHADHLWVTNLEARNGEFIGEKSWPEGRVTRSRITRVLPTQTAADVADIHVIDGNAAGSASNVVQPADLVADGLDRVWVCGYGSSNLGVFDDQGQLVGTVATDSGPRGVTIAPNGSLYVLSRGHNRVLRYDASGALPTTHDLAVDLVDPTPENIKAGRRQFISSTNSGSGTTSCNSCHVDGRKDGLGWDLSAYLDDTIEHSVESPPEFWLDRKGVMVTQDLRGLAETSPFHWRGEQHDLIDFNGAFEELLHGAPLGVAEFEEFQDFVFSLTYPANPTQQLNRTFTDSAHEILDDIANVTVESNGSCARCHTEPFGTNNDLPFAGSPASGSGFVQFVPMPAQLRGLVFKDAGRCSVIDGATSANTSTIGFGLEHNGSIPDIDGFIEKFFAEPPYFEQPRKDMVHEWDTGIAPAAHYSELLTAAHVGNSHLDFMIAQAEAGNCDLAGRGHLEFLGVVDQDVGVLYDPSTDVFVFDDDAFQPMPASTIQSLIASGNLELLMLCTPVGSGKRFGLDMDRDGLFDMNELRRGLDPWNPDSDGDSLWDGYDLEPDIPNDLSDPTQLPAGAPIVYDIRIDGVTTTTVKLTYRTDVPSPTRIAYGLTPAFGESFGDPVPLPAGSKRWRTVHTALLRRLEPDRDYHFEIQTRGQNGEETQFGTYTVKTDPNNTNRKPYPQVQVDQLTISSFVPPPFPTIPPGRMWNVEVRVVDAHGVPQSGMKVQGFFIHERTGDETIQALSTSAITDANGLATVSSIVDGQSPGDQTRFVLPQFLRDSSDRWILPVYLNGTNPYANGEQEGEESVFAWPDSTARTVVGLTPSE